MIIAGTAMLFRIDQLRDDCISGIFAIRFNEH